MTNKEIKLNHFEILNQIDLTGKIEKKKDLSYLSWASAWAEIKKNFPNASYQVIKHGEQQLPYQMDERTGYLVTTEMTIDGITHQMWLPVMDGSNKAMKTESYKYKTKYGDKTVEAATMFDINKTIMRCLVKNMAMFGLGLYVYEGEELPQDRMINDEELRQLEEKLKEVGGNSEKILNHFNIDSLSKLKSNQFTAVLSSVERKSKIDNVKKIAIPNE